MNKLTTKPLYRLTFSAVMVALSVALSYFKISTGGFGGSIDFVMIPLFIVCFIEGPLYGVAAGAVFGLIKCIMGGGISWGLPSILLDYVLAYAAIGVAGFFRKKSLVVIGLSTLLGCFARFIIHFISGVTIYAITTAETVSGVTTSNAWLYSVIYNGLYMLPNTVIAVVLMVALTPVLKRIEKM